MNCTPTEIMIFFMVEIKFSIRLENFLMKSNIYELI